MSILSHCRRCGRVGHSGDTLQHEVHCPDCRTGMHVEEAGAKASRAFFVQKKRHYLPYPENSGRTHWEGCWRHRGHHNCAVARVDQLESELEEWRLAAEMACECPLEDCDCPGCRKAAEHYRKEEDP